MAVLVSSFREALAHFATGVTIVTARSGGVGEEELVGFTATSFTSVSLDPPLVLVCVNHTASARERFLRAATFGVSVLREDQSRLAEQFARKGVDRFAGVKLVPGTGAPLIEGAVVQLECRAHVRHEVGDHTAVFGEVVSARTTPARPLLYFDRRFATVGPDPASPEVDAAMSADEPEA